jgi:hypothetical protein
MIPLVISTCVFGVLLVVALVLCTTVPMLADAPGSTNVPGVLLMIYSVFALPVVILVALAAAWRLFAAGLPDIAFWVSLAPLLNLAVIAYAGYRLWRRRSW